MWVLLKPLRFGGAKSCKRSRQSVSTLPSRYFQVHGVDNEGKVVIRRQLKRRYVLAFFEKLQPCLVGIGGPCLGHTIGHASCGTWPYRAVDAAGLRQALRQTAEERCAGRRDHL